MAKFMFGLQNYLNLKQKLEEQKKLEYGQSLAVVEQEKSKKKLLQKERENCLFAIKESVSNKINTFSVINYNRFIELLGKRIEEQDKRIKKAEVAAEKKRLELVSAMKDRKMIDTLREKKLEEHMIEENKKDQKLMDELVSYRYNGGT